MSVQLTDEQRARIAENKRKALERFAQRQQQLQQHPTTSASYIQPQPPKRSSANDKPPAPDPINFSLLLKGPNARKIRKPSEDALSPIPPPAKKSTSPAQQTAPPTGPPAKKTTTTAQQSASIGPALQKTTLPAQQPVSTGTNVKPKGFNPLDGYRPRVNVEFELEAVDKIKVVIRPTHMAVVDAIKASGKARYDAKTKNWYIDFPSYHATITRMKSIKNVDCMLKMLPKWIDYIFRDQIKGTTQTQVSSKSQEVDSCLRNAAIEESLLKKLFPYQRRGVAFGLEKQGRLLIADEMGLGKSLQALAIARAFF